MRWETIFFDFDGVIADSVDIKTRAFAKMFETYGKDVENKVIQYHLSHGGVSRFDKFRYFYENFLEKEISQQELDRLCNTFSELVLHGVIDSPLLPGALETLEHIKKNDTSAYIISGTPHDEIIIIAKQKNLTHFFQGIYGSPRSKDDIVKEILQEKGYANHNCLFIGDSMSDYQAAVSNQIHFLGIVTDASASPFPKGTDISATISIDRD